MSHQVIARIDLSALSHNFAYIQKLLSAHELLSSPVLESRPSAAIMAIIKNNAYGHGLLRVAGALPKADAFGVSSLEEALILREAAIQTPITVITGFEDKTECSECSRWGLHAVVHQLKQVCILEENRGSTSPLSVWLKIDTGMRRLGFLEKEALSMYRRLEKCPSVKKPVGVMTHLADADNVDSEFTQQQIMDFSAITRDCSGAKSVVNSAGLLAYPEARLDCVRPGIMLYGISPFADPLEALRPVMTLSAKLMSIKQCRQGDYVGYGCTWRCPENMPIGVVSIGYGDGYPRHAENGTPTAVRGVICPLVGRVSMDMLTIDLRPQPEAREGDTVVLWGDAQVPIEQVAACAGTIPYELLCQLSSRVQFLEA